MKAGAAMMALGLSGCAAAQAWSPCPGTPVSIVASVADRGRLRVLVGSTQVMLDARRQAEDWYAVRDAVNDLHERCGVEQMYVRADGKVRYRDVLGLVQALRSSPVEIALVTEERRR